MQSEEQTWAMAWEMAYQTRCCPPEDVLLADNPGPEALAHLRVCPCCSELRFHAAAEGLPAQPPRPGGMSAARPATPAPAVGQLWTLAPRLNGWGPKQRYYSSPVVLVLREALQLENAVLVAQTYHDPLMCGQDDVPLGPERFAQPWNVYTLHRRDLDRCCGQVDIERAGRVLHASQRPFPHLDPRSVLFLFRQMEIEVGCFFSSLAVFTLMEEYKTQAGRAADAPRLRPAGQDAQLAPGHALPEIMATPPWLGTHLAGLGLEVPAQWLGVSAADLYFLAAPPAAATPLAAAGPDSNQAVPVLAFNMGDGGPISWRLLEAKVADYVCSPQVMVGGWLETSLPPDEQWWAEFRWRDGSGRLVGSQASFLSPQGESSPRFWALFPLEEAGAPSLGDRLLIRLFRKTARQA